MVNQELIQSFLLQLEEKLALLNRTPVDSLSHLQKEPILQNAILHLLQTSIEICLDMANHIIADEGWRSPTSNRDTFAILFEHNVINENLLSKCQHMAGFRNILVHMYEKVDLADVHAVLKNHLHDFFDYSQAIKTFLPST
jgi:uncharacterized protein YutE (UPF0331/DUF86 family)